MLTINTVELFYQYFYSHKYKGSKYKFKRSKATKSVCENFLKLVDKHYNLQTVGEQFLWDYFIFQFQYWHDAALENPYSKETLIAWVVGKKAFERWAGRDQSFNWTSDKAIIINLYAVQKKDLFTVHEHEQIVNVNRFDSSARIRRQFLNSDSGFAMCIEFTTLFDPADKSCKKCNNSTECTAILKANFPLLYNKRLK